MGCAHIGVTTQCLLFPRGHLRMARQRAPRRQLRRQRVCKALGIFARIVGRHAFVGKQRGVGPNGLAVGAPVNAQGPARQLFARVPLALAEVRQPLRRVLLLEAAVELDGETSFVRPHRLGVPLRPIRIVHRHEGGFAAHGQAYVVRQQLRVDVMAELFDLRPLCLGVRLGDARRFPDALDTHVVFELDFSLVDGAGDWRGGDGLGRAGQRNVAFAREQARGGIEANPARAR